MVPDHALYIKVFDTDSLVFAYQFDRSLVQEVITLVMYTFMEPGNLYTLFVTVIGALLFTGKAALLPAEFLKESGQALRVVNSITVTIGIERLKAHVKAYGLIRDVDMHRLEVNQQDSKILTGGRTLYGNAMDTAYIHRLAHLYISELRELKVSSGDTYIVALVDGPV